MSKQIELSRLASHSRLRAQFLARREGGITAMFAIGLPVIVGMAGLAVETGLWYQSRRELQSAADTASLAGALELVRNNSSNVTTAATNAAVRNGFVNASPSTIAVTTPYGGNDKKVEVVLTREENRLFTRVFAANSVTVRARAVAQMIPYGDACVLALDTGAIDAAEATGSTTITLADCMIAANSTAPVAIHLSGNANVTSEGLWTSGGYAIDGSAVGTFDQPPVTSAAAIIDPYAALGVPSYSGCDHNNYQVNSDVTLNPGVYCGKFKFTGNMTANLTPGVYILDAAEFDVGAQVLMRCPTCTGGAGVTFILTSSTGWGNVGNVTINGGADIQLDAPRDSANPYNGVLFYQDRRITSNPVSTFNGGANMSFGGAIYMPRTEIRFQGNNTYNQVRCTHIIGLQVTLTGNSGLDNTGCEDAGWLKVNAWSVDLVE